MQAIVESLELTWSLGIKKNNVQSDSASIVDILANGSALKHQHAILVLKFKEFCRRQWEVNLSHIYRKATCVADYLPNLGQLFCLWFTCFWFA
ncbi:hypothetical protein LINGRAHAP2_LOCUS32224 [Linum grandiflorum]